MYYPLNTAALAPKYTYYDRDTGPDITGPSGSSMPEPTIVGESTPNMVSSGPGNLTQDLR